MLKSKIVNAVGTTEVTVQTAPVGKAHIVLGVIARNKTGGIVGGVVKVVKSTGETLDLIPASPLWLPYENQYWEGKLFLEAGDMIKTVSDTASSLDIITSYTEEDNT